MNSTECSNVDVEACVRLLNGYADVLEGRALLGPATMAIREKEAAMFRALASALPGMGKDSERLPWLIAHQGTIGHYGGKWHASYVDGEYDSATEAIDAAIVARARFLCNVANPAARAAQPEETKP